MLVLYRSKILQSKGVSPVSHGHHVSRRCVGGPLYRKELGAMLTAGCKTMTQTLLVRKDVREDLANADHF